jgi:glycosyltransferase involved in cell wall biosynthesis
VDAAPFRAPVPDRVAVRRSLGLQPDARIMLFAGRMAAHKNPVFALEVFARVAPLAPDAVAVFAGTGPLEGVVRERAAELGLADRVRVLGWRDDTRDLMRASDLFVFPRVDRPMNGVGIEGLGLVVVEAQAAGLLMLISPGVPPDAVVSPDLATTLPLAAGVDAWATAAHRILLQPRPDPALALARVEQSHFAMDAAWRSLRALYE